MKVRLIGACLLFAVTTSHSQNLPTERTTAWDKAGPTSTLTAPNNSVNIVEFGADNTGESSCNQAYNAALASLGGSAGTIYFPTGEYFFDASISIPDSVFIKGESSETELEFDLGGTGHCIQMNGSISSQENPLAETAIKGCYEITLTDASALENGDYIRISMFDEDYMLSTWAFGTLGQLVQISEISGNTLLLEDPLNHHFPLTRTPIVKKVTPRVAAGIECLKLKRMDETVGQKDNIRMTYATNCVIRNIESEDCNYGHVNMLTCSHNLIERSYFHHAHAYGGGGKGYGVVAQATSCFNLVEDNIFEHLRHSMILQSAANSNVFGYNYSIDPYWEDGILPANSAGDAVLHGNYTTMNLFEGNVVQHIVIDASHGSNGPFNTFFRNRSELYGFFSDMNTVTDSMNVIGNEITNEGFFLGLFALNGVGHFSYGNNHRGTVTPSGTANLETNTLYLNETSLPDFLENETLPMIGYPLAMNEKTIPAEIRFENEVPISCNPQIVTAIRSEPEPEINAAVIGNQLLLNKRLLPATIQVFNTAGQLIKEARSNSTMIDLSDLSTNSIHLIRISNGKETHYFKVLISR